MKNEAVMERLDHESRTQEDDHHSIRLWLRLLTCSNLIESKLRSHLREEFNITLPRFDFLAQLERAPEGLTMGELSQRMMVSGGNISGIATQLEGEGLINRSPSWVIAACFVSNSLPKGLPSFNAWRFAMRNGWLKCWAGLTCEKSTI